MCLWLCLWVRSSCVWVYLLFASKSGRVNKTAFLRLLRKPIQGKFHFDHERTQYSTEIKNYNAARGKKVYIHLNNNEEKQEYRFNISKTCWIKEPAKPMYCTARQRNKVFACKHYFFFLLDHHGIWIWHILL